MITDADVTTLVSRLGSQEPDSGDDHADWIEQWATEAGFDVECFRHLTVYLGRCAADDQVPDEAREILAEVGGPDAVEQIAAQLAASCVRALILGFELGKQSAETDSALAGLDFDADPDPDAE